MNIEPLEEKLLALRPAAPSPALMARLLAAEPTRFEVLPDPTAAPAPAVAPAPVQTSWMRLAAMFVLLGALTASFLHWGRPHGGGTPKKELAAQSPEKDYQPISTENVLLNTSDLGLVAREGSPPVHLYYRLWSDRELYKEPSSGHTVFVEKLREQLVPVSLTEQ